ncbi:MAG: serine hydrolase [Synechococcaceae cyanobacterium SM2_3_1]|nr:serine hydrolase [Synechococcaceae cyanobacterium SM2_3_1]
MPARNPQSRERLAPRPSTSPRSTSRKRRAGKTPASRDLILLRAAALSISLGLLIGGISQLLRSVFPESAPEQLTPVSQGETSQAVLFNQPLRELETQLAPFLERPGLTPHLIVADVDSSSYADVRGSEPIPAASTIKLPILVAFLQAVDNGLLPLDETLTIDPSLVVGEAGVLQNRPEGSQVTALQAATLMMTISDNTATNLLIDRLGGREGLNPIFRQWGLQHTQLVELLPDLEGQNTTSALDMVTLLHSLEAGQLLSLRSRDRLMDMMRRTETPALLSLGLGENSRFAHKTGTISSVVGDVGIVDMPTGGRYLVAVWVARATPNDPAAVELIRQLSETVYQFWLRPQPSPTAEG